MRAQASEESAPLRFEAAFRLMSRAGSSALFSTESVKKSQYLLLSVKRHLTD